jgi:hypothetical protein
VMTDKQLRDELQVRAMGGRGCGEGVAAQARG